MFRPLHPLIRLHLSRTSPRTHPVLACVLMLALGLGFSLSSTRLTQWQRGGNAPVLVELARAEAARALGVMLASGPLRVAVPVRAQARPIAAAHAVPLAFALRCLPPPATGA